MCSIENLHVSIWWTQLKCAKHNKDNACHYLVCPNTNKGRFGETIVVNELGSSEPVVFIEYSGQSQVTVAHWAWLGKHQVFEFWSGENTLLVSLVSMPIRKVFACEFFARALQITWCLGWFKANLWFCYPTQNNSCNAWLQVLQHEFVNLNGLVYYQQLVQFLYP